MKKALISLSALLLSLTSFASSDFGVGMGLGVSNSLYKGDDEKSSPVPVLNIDYGNLYIRGAADLEDKSLSVGYTFYQDDMFAASLFVDPLSGFDVDGDDLSSGYNNIDDRKYQAMFGVRLDADTGINGVQTGFSAKAGKDGAEFKISAFRPTYINEKLILVPSVYMKGYTADYADYYFGVTSEEAKRNSKISKKYEADAAYSFGANLTAEYSLSDNLALLAFLGVEKFSSEITDSPIVDDDILYLMGIGAKYHF
nr:MipA/OmpV family protein [uncultured Cetobacterium sp.]